MTPAPQDILHRHAQIVFEGAQGLLLDQDKGTFPYVTRSHTGVRNAATLACEAGIDALEVHYVTRSYLTRHGAGPLPRELPAKPYANIIDATNIPNPFQGALRFAWLDLDLLKASVERDLADAPQGVRCDPRLVVTCMDQLGDKATFVHKGQVVERHPLCLLKTARQALGGEAIHASYGPTREDVRTMK